MIKMQDEWRAYRDACYPDGTDAIQNRECHQAFFAGALSVMNALTGPVTQLSDEEGVKAVEKLSVEIRGVCNARVATLEAMN